MINKQVPEQSRKLMQGYHQLLNLSRQIAKLPLGKWLEDIEHAEAIGPIVDPTLFREYLYSGKPELIKKIIRAALPLKKAIEEAQKQILASPQKFSIEVNPDYAEVMTIEDFEEQCKAASFIDYDGSGYYSDGTCYDRTKPAIPSEIVKNGINKAFTHVAWFNK